MKKLLHVVLLSFQGFAQSQQSGTVIGHLVARDSRTTSTGIRVGIRTLEGSSFVGFTQSDESGRYRFDGVPPGRYYIAAGLSESPTYYPGVTGLIDAQSVKVVAGSVVTGVDFMLANPVEIRLKGRVVIEGGGEVPQDVAGMIGSALPGPLRPQKPALVRMISRRVPNGPSTSVTVQADGTFELAVPPGENQIVVQGLPLGYYVKSIVAGAVDILQFPFIVSEDPPVIEVTLTRTAPLSNPPVVTVRGRVNGLPADAASKWVILQSGTTGPAIFGVPSSIGEGPIQDDGSFEFRGVPPGNYSITLMQSGASSRQNLLVPRGDIGGIELTWSPPLPARGPISVPPVPVVNVSGRIDGFPGVALPPTIRLTSQQASRSTSVNSDGTFEFTDVPRAGYQVRVGRDAASNVRNFTVGNQDITGIEIKSPVEAAGRIVMADGGSLPPLLFQIKSEYAAGSPGSVPVLPTIQHIFDIRDDGTFVVGVVRGEQKVSVLGLPAAYSVKSIVLGQTNLLESPLSLSALPTSEIVVTLERTSDAAPNFRIVYEYGHGSFFHANSFDSFRGTLTRDMVGDPPQTFNFRLSDAQLSQIEKKLDEIDFWNAQKYPTVFSMPNPGPMGCSSTGRQPIFLFVVRGQTSRELTWLDQDTVCGAPTPEGGNLRSLETLIQGMIGSSPDYARLPKPRGTYID